MSERMWEGKFSGLWSRVTHGGGDSFDARVLAHEAARARRVEQEQAEELRAVRDVLRRIESALGPGAGAYDARVQAQAERIALLETQCREHNVAMTAQAEKIIAREQENARKAERITALERKLKALWPATDRLTDAVFAYEEEWDLVAGHKDDELREAQKAACAVLKETKP